MPAGNPKITVGKKGSHGCKGYPVVGGEGKVHGCHATLEEAQNQQAAIYASINSNKSDMPCTPDSPDCGNDMCKVCMKKIWAGSAFDSTKSFGYPSANNPLPAGHAGPNSPVSGVVNHPKSTQQIKN